MNQKEIADLVEEIIKSKTYKMMAKFEAVVKVMRADICLRQEIK